MSIEARKTNDIDEAEAQRRLRIIAKVAETRRKLRRLAEMSSVTDRSVDALPAETVIRPEPTKDFAAQPEAARLPMVS